MGHEWFGKWSGWVKCIWVIWWMKRWIGANEVVDDGLKVDECKDV